MIRAQCDFNRISLAAGLHDVADLVEAWLRRYREYQRTQWELFRQETFQYYAAVDLFAASKDRNPEDLDFSSWVRFWDEAPWVFVAGQQVPLTNHERKVCW